MGYNENFSRAFVERDIPLSVLRDFLQKLVDTNNEKKEQRMMDQFAAEVEASYPYKPGKNPVHKASLKQKGINLDNWLQHLDEMSDEEITFMLDQELDAGRMEAEGNARPAISCNKKNCFMIGSVIKCPERNCPVKMTIQPMGYNKHFDRVFQERNIPLSVLRGFLQQFVASGKENEKQRMMNQFAAEVEATYPYRPGGNPVHKASLEQKGIDQGNWLRHLDEMSDEEITFMLDQEPDAGRIAEDRKANPDISDRTRAEFLRDF